MKSQYFTYWLSIDLEAVDEMLDCRTLEIFLDATLVICGSLFVHRNSVIQKAPQLSQIRKRDGVVILVSADTWSEGVVTSETILATTGINKEMVYLVASRSDFT